MAISLEKQRELRAREFDRAVEYLLEHGKIIQREDKKTIMTARVVYKNTTYELYRAKHVKTGSVHIAHVCLVLPGKRESEEHLKIVQRRNLRHIMK